MMPLCDYDEGLTWIWDAVGALVWRMEYVRCMMGNCQQSRRRFGANATALKVREYLTWNAECEESNRQRVATIVTSNVQSTER